MFSTLHAEFIGATYDLISGKQTNIITETSLARLASVFLIFLVFIFGAIYKKSKEDVVLLGRRGQAVPSILVMVRDGRLAKLLQPIRLLSSVPNYHTALPLLNL